MAPFLTQLPRGTENPDEVFFYADRAFQSGQFSDANRDFGTLFLIAPGIQGGAPEQALAITCQRLGIDCDLQLTRLRFMRDGLYGAFGPRNGWHPQQEADFRSIIACYDHALIGDFASAGRFGAPVANAPLDGFRAAAGTCMQRVDQAMADARRREVADQAWGAWQQAWPCVDQNHRALMNAANGEDWEAFVEVLPRWEQCAPTIQRIIDDAVLEGDPRVGVQHDMAWTHLGEVELILEDHEDDIRRTRQGLIALDRDPDWDRLQVELNQLAFAEERVQNQIASLQQAQAMLGPNDAAALQSQVDQLGAELITIRNQRRQVQGGLNAVRAAHGLPPRN